jgi:protein-L-isoaspartate(D-aspartate) O-methyltransferase
VVTGRPESNPSGTEAKVAFLMALRARGFRDTDLLRAFETVPRGHFVSRRYADLALGDVTLPIPCGQTLSAPSTLAEMVRALDPLGADCVLEIGTGTGYGTGILSRLARRVVSVERFRSLAIEARARLEALDIHNAEVLHGDGRLGIPGAEPFDRIIIHASFDEPPLALLGQLAPGGLLVGVKRTRAQSRMAVYRMSITGSVTEELQVAMSLPPLIVGASSAL